MSTIDLSTLRKKIVKEDSKNVKYTFLKHQKSNERFSKSTDRMDTKPINLPPIKLPRQQERATSPDQILDLFLTHRDQTNKMQTQKKKIFADATTGFPLIRESNNLFTQLSKALDNTKGETELEIKINKMLLCSDFITRIPVSNEIKEILNIIKKNYDFCAQEFLKEYLNAPVQEYLVGQEDNFAEKIRENSNLLDEIKQLEQENEELSQSLKNKSEELEYLKTYEKRLSEMILDVRPRGVVENLEVKRKEFYDKLQIMKELRDNLTNQCQPREQVKQVRLERIDALTEISELEEENKLIAERIAKHEKEAEELLEIIGLDVDQRRNNA